MEKQPSFHGNLLEIILMQMQNVFFVYDRTLIFAAKAQPDIFQAHVFRMSEKDSPGRQYAEEALFRIALFIFRYCEIRMFRSTAARERYVVLRAEQTRTAVYQLIDILKLADGCSSFFPTMWNRRLACFLLYILYHGDRRDACSTFF
jgi:hypothetical protein